MAARFRTWLLVSVVLPHPHVQVGGVIRESRRCETDPPPPMEGFDPASLVASASVIVRARADSSGRSAVPLALNIHDVVYFTVLEVVDSGGVAIPAHLAVAGWLSDKADFSPDKVPYRWTRPDGARGSCWAFNYQRGGEFLLLLKGAGTGTFTPYWAALHPTNMQVRGAKDPWVEWVRAARRRK